MEGNRQEQVEVWRFQPHCLIAHCPQWIRMPKPNRMKYDGYVCGTGSAM